MKFVLIAALAAFASTMRVTRGDEAHETIFEGCSSNSDCPDGKYCITWSAAWNYCKEWCTLGGTRVTCWWFVWQSIIMNLFSIHSFKMSPYLNSCCFLIYLWFDRSISRSICLRPEIRQRPQILVLSIQSFSDCIQQNLLILKYWKIFNKNCTTIF